MTPTPDFLAQIGDLSVPPALPVVGSWSDDGLLDAQRSIAEVRRRIDSLGAVVAGEIAHRSRRELGHDGLAQSRGQRTPEGLISQLTGTSTREARTLVKTAELLPVETSRPEVAPVTGWLAVLGDAVAAARISVEAAELIRTRLSAVNDATSDGADPALREALERAATTLVADAAGLTLEQLAIRAARARDELDLAGIAAREEALRDKRFLRVTKQLDGMTRIHGLLDPESAAILVPVLDAATSPRRGGSGS